MYKISIGKEKQNGFLISIDYLSKVRACVICGVFKKRNWASCGIFFINKSFLFENKKVRA